MCLRRCQLLEIVDVGFNQLCGAIPPELAQLRSLTELYLDHNDFASVPLELDRCCSRHGLLKKLTIENNPQLKIAQLSACLSKILVSPAPRPPVAPSGVGGL